MALETVHREARSVRRIIFVLWEDRLYDTWISMAQELQVIPMEDDRTAIMNIGKSNVSTHPIGADHDRTHQNTYSTMRVDDASSNSAIKHASKNDAPTEVQSASAESKQYVDQCGRMDNVRQIHTITMLIPFMITGSRFSRLPFCRNHASLERRI